jgi:small subunit ribosomal protein S18
MMRGSQARQRRLREQDQQQQGGSPTRSIDRDLLDKHAAADYQRQLTRRWKAGDVYAPHDMSAGEMGKWRRTSARKQDLVDLLGLHPLDMYRNFSVMSEFMTPHGRMKRAVETGLRPVNQRKMAKAVRRAIGLGLHPSVHRHPELLLREVVRQRPQHMATIFDHKV